MSNLIKNNNDQLTEKFDSSASQIMAVCRTITPQFYRGLTDTDLKAEKAAIKLLTAHIEPAVMSKMCELAVQNYGTARSDNSKTYFDVNYILTFYRAAFNWYWCDSVELPQDTKRLGYSYDPISRTITERWTDGKKEITVKYIVNEDYNGKIKKIEYIQNHYTPKYWEYERKKQEMLFDNPNFEI